MPTAGCARSVEVIGEAEAAEVLDGLAPAVPGGKRRHGERRVLGQHREDRVHVASLPRIDVTLDEPTEAIVAERAKVGLLALGGNDLRDRLPGASKGTVR